MKTLLITLGLFCLSLSFSQGQVVLAQWTFPTGNPTDSLADGGIPGNLTKAIHTEGGTSAIDFSKNGFTTKAAQATGWDNGNDQKCWVVEITTSDYHQIRLSSRQQSGGNYPGPRDWKVQYRPAVASYWTDVPNTLLEVQNDWTTGVLDSVELPAACNNQLSLFIRWIMTSNTNSIGDPVTANGISKIDDIIITGKLINSVISEPDPVSALLIYPNPSDEQVTIQSGQVIDHLAVTDVRGTVILCVQPRNKLVILDVSHLPSGYYLVRATVKPGNPISRKLIIR